MHGKIVRLNKFLLNFLDRIYENLEDISVNLKIYERKDGRWEGRYINGVSSAGTKYGYVYGKTRDEVENKLLASMVQMKHSDIGFKDTFAAIATEWLNAITPQLKPSSVAKYNNTMNLYLLPYLGNRMIVSLSRKEISQLCSRLLTTGGAKSNGLAAKTVDGVLSVVKSIFLYASIEHNLAVSDLNGISIKQPQKHMRILSRIEQQKLCRYLYAHQTPCNIGILLCLFTGLRIGEVCAMKWKDICISEHYISVNKTMQRIQVSGINNTKTQVIVQTPKSDCSIRRIPLPRELLDLLTSLKICDEAYLLTGTADHFIEPRSLSNQFKRVVKESGVSDLNFHALRHTFATRCVELGFDIKSLSEILGHASVSITLNRYVHPSMELKQKNMDMLSELLTAESMVKTDYVYQKS